MTSVKATWLRIAVEQLNIPLDKKLIQSYRGALGEFFKDRKEGGVFVSDGRPVGIGISLNPEEAAELGKQYLKSLYAPESAQYLATDILDQFWISGQRSLAVVVLSDDVMKKKKYAYFGEFSQPVLTVGKRQVYVEPVYDKDATGKNMQIKGYNVYEGVSKIGFISTDKELNKHDLADRIYTDILSKSKIWSPFTAPKTVQQMKLGGLRLKVSKLIREFLWRA